MPNTHISIRTHTHRTHANSCWIHHSTHTIRPVSSSSSTCQDFHRRTYTLAYTYTQDTRKSLLRSSSNAHHQASQQQQQMSKNPKHDKHTHTHPYAHTHTHTGHTQSPALLIQRTPSGQSAAAAHAKSSTGAHATAKTPNINNNNPLTNRRLPSPSVHGPRILTARRTLPE